jgi:heat shock protein HtpX
LADATAVEFTRNPEGLARALVKVHVCNSLFKKGLPRTFAPLYIVAPLPVNESSVDLFATHPPIFQRIKRLKEMENIEYTLEDFEKDIEAVLIELSSD